MAKKETQVFFTKAQLYKTTKSIEAAIAKAVVAGNAVQVEYQKIACSAIVHVGQHGDIRIIRNLLETMPEGMRQNSMAAFFDKYAPVAFDAEGVAHYDKTKSVRLGEALEAAWWKTLKPETYTPFVFADEVQKLYDKAQKRFAKADPSKGDAITVAQLDLLQQIISANKGQPINQTIEKAPKAKNKAA